MNLKHSLSSCWAHTGKNQTGELSLLIVALCATAENTGLFYIFSQLVMGRRRRGKWITQGKPKELKFMFVNNSYIKYLHNLNISALSLSWTASLTYAKLVYGKCFDIIWHHVRPYQWFKENSFFKEANYQVPTPDTCLSYSCQRSVVRLELPLSFIHLT